MHGYSKVHIVLKGICFCIFHSSKPYIWVFLMRSETQILSTIRWWSNSLNKVDLLDFLCNYCKDFQLLISYISFGRPFDVVQMEVEYFEDFFALCRFNCDIMLDYNSLHSSGKYMVNHHCHTPIGQFGKVLPDQKSLLVFRTESYSPYLG